MRSVPLWRLSVALFALSCSDSGPNSVAFGPDSGLGDATQPGADAIDDALGAWTQAARMPTDRSEVAVALSEQTVYVAGGYNGPSTFEAYDLATDSWRVLAPLPAPLDHASLAAVSGVVYLTGGGAASLYAYDPARDAWTALSSMPEARYAAAAVVLDSMIYVVGGVGPSPLTMLQRYDPVTDTWATLAPLREARDHVAAVVLDDEIWALSGRRPDGSNFTVAELSPGTDASGSSEARTKRRAPRRAPGSSTCTGPESLAHATVPKMTGSRRVFLVTGATGAIGEAIANRLAETMNHEVVLAARDAGKATSAVGRIRRRTNNPSVRHVIVDVSSRESIEELVASFAGPLHVLINNAAIAPRRRETTPEGIERQFATNVLGYLRMTQAFADLLATNAPARVVNVASYWAGDLDVDDLEFRRRRYDNDAAYRQSKQANRMLTVALADELAPRVTVNACHPGDVDSQLSRDLGFGGHESPESGADTPVFVASDPTGQEVTGAYFEHRRPKQCRFGSDREAVRALYSLCRDRYRSATAVRTG